MIDGSIDIFWSTYKVVCAVFFLCSALGSFEETCVAVHKVQSDTRWESRIKCIKPLRYNLKEVLLALKDLEAISIERKDGRAASETKSLIAH